MVLVSKGCGLEVKTEMIFYRLPGFPSQIPRGFSVKFDAELHRKTMPFAPQDVIVSGLSHARFPRYGKRKLTIFWRKIMTDERGERRLKDIERQR